MCVSVFPSLSVYLHFSLRLPARMCLPVSLPLYTRVRGHTQLRKVQPNTATGAHTHCRTASRWIPIIAKVPPRTAPPPTSRAKRCHTYMRSCSWSGRQNHVAATPARGTVVSLLAPVTTPALPTAKAPLDPAPGTCTYGPARYIRSKADKTLYCRIWHSSTAHCTAPNYPPQVHPSTPHCNTEYSITAQHITPFIT